MRPGDIQDERSKDKHCGAQYKGHCELRKCHMKRIYSQTRAATASRQTRSGFLSSRRRQQLDRVVTVINEHTVSMTESLNGAANTQFIDPAFKKKLVAVKDDLKAVAVAVMMCREQNEEHGTAQVKLRASLRVVEARRWFTYLDKILAMQRPEL